MPDDEEDGYDGHPENTECNCAVCRLKRDINSQAAANGRRGFWVDVFMESIKQRKTPEIAAKTASQSVKEFDKAFPEVQTAAMREDR